MVGERGVGGVGYGIHWEGEGGDGWMDWWRGNCWGAAATDHERETSSLDVGEMFAV